MTLDRSRFEKERNHCINTGASIPTGCSKKTAPLFYFCNNFRKWTPILTIFSPLEQEIYDA